MARWANALFVKYISVFFIICNLALCSCCGVMHSVVEDHNCTENRRKFPSYFSIKSSLIYRALKRIYHLHIEVDIAYNQHIQFVIKGPLSSVILRGFITEHGITLSELLHRQTYFLSYEQIKQQYAFCIHYSLIQSFLLGIAYNENSKANLKEKTSGQGDIIKYVFYTYDENSNTLIRAQLIDSQHRYCINVLYRYQKKNKKQPKYCFNDLSSIQIHFSCKEANRFSQSSIVLPKLRFKKKRSLNIKALSLSIP